MAQTIQHLSADAFLHLKQKLNEYIRLLLSETLTEATHRHAAQHLGRLHAQLGIRPRWSMQLYNRLQSTLYQTLHTDMLDAVDREALLRIIYDRIYVDVAEQLAGYEQIEREISDAIAKCEKLAHGTKSFSDLMYGILEIIGNLSGFAGVFFARVDSTGELQIEASKGVAGQRYHAAMMSGETPKISIDPTLESGRGPGGRAWREGKIVCSDAWLIDQINRPWHKVGRKLGFRSSAAVPILDDIDRSIALLSLYSSVPRFFVAPRIYNFLLLIQLILSDAIQRFRRAPVIPLHERTKYRDLLDRSRAVGYFQPIIDLKSGALRKFEVLCRLIDDNEAIIEPAKFLPTFGLEELLRIFEICIEEGIVAYQKMASLGVAAIMTVNFPAEGISDDRFTDVLIRKIGQHGLRPHQVEIEILEGRDLGVDESIRHVFLERIRAANILIAQDDLGSAYSSLFRLDQYGFDDVKIDQSLVRSALSTPKRALEFILYLTRLAHSLDIKITVEGLENHGMIEAAAILGADYGQGYGIGKPMPLLELIQWHRDFYYRVTPKDPNTALGALAVYLGWCLQVNSAQLVVHNDSPLDAEIQFASYLRSRPGTNNCLGDLIRKHFSGDFSSYGETKAQIIEELTGMWFDELTTPTEKTH